MAQASNRCPGKIGSVARAWRVGMLRPSRQSPPEWKRRPDFGTREVDEYYDTFQELESIGRFKIIGKISTDTMIRENRPSGQFPPPATSKSNRSTAISVSTSMRGIRPGFSRTPQMMGY